MFSSENLTQVSVEDEIRNHRLTDINHNMISGGHEREVRCKSLSFYMWTPGRVELQLRDGENIFIHCTGVEDAFHVTMAQRSERDDRIHNDPLGYADLILNGDPEEYLKNVTGSCGLED